MDNNIHLLEQVLNDSNEMIQVSDVETFSMLYANEPARNYTGHSNQPYKGMHCYEYMMGLKEQCPFCPMRQLGDNDWFETEVDNGKEIYAVKTKKIIWEGKEAFIEYAWDITDIRRSQQIYEAQIRTLISAIPDAQGVFHMDVTQDQVLTINGNSKEVLKMKDKASVNGLVEMVCSYVPDREGQKVLFKHFNRDALLAAYNKGKAEINVETESYFDDGSIREARITGRLLMNPQTNHLECIIYGMDISEEKRKERESEAALRKALAIAEQANKAKTIFLSNMSHDIRTPMNAIIGYTALATSHIDNTELVKDYLNKINTSSTNLLSLINDVLDMSHIESGHVQIEETEVHIPDILHDLQTMIQGNIKAKQLALYMDSKNVIHKNIITDKLRLNRALLNIISNAVKFTPTGGEIHVCVSERTCDKKDYAMFDFAIRDNGIGMSEEFQKHVFDSFSRERTTTKTGISGTGLGLAIAKNIVDMMGGTICVKSEEGKGSEFIVSLTCKLSEKKTSCNQTPPEKCLNHTGKHILLVEDNELNREIAEMILTEAGLLVDSVEDGLDAVNTMKSISGEKYDLILMDIQMPKMDGYTATREIRTLANNKAANIPIVAMTANAFEEDKQKAFKVGMNAHIAKPIDRNILMEVLNQIFEK